MLEVCSVVTTAAAVYGCLPLDSNFEQRSMSIALKALLAVLVLLLSACGNVLDPKYRTTCLFSPPTSAVAQKHACDVALFTFRDISFHGPALFLNDGLCASSLDSFSHLRGALGEAATAVVVKRGECSFTLKAQNAEALGFKLLLIVNSETEGFPIGPAQVDFPLHIPVLMAGEGVWENAEPYRQPTSLQVSDVDGTPLRATAEGSTAGLLPSLHKLDVDFVAVSAPARAPVPLHSTSEPLRTHSQAAQMTAKLNTRAVWAVGALFTLAAAATATIFVTAVYTSLCSPLAPVSFTSQSTGAPSDWLASIVLGLSFVLVGAVFLTLRLGTLRVYAPADSHSNTTGADMYNHRETDERVFEALVHNVLSDPGDYRLHASTIQELGLAPENYSDSLFIHPPVFVYLSAALHGHLGVPLPLIPLLLQGATLLLMLVVCRAISPRKNGGESSSYIALQSWVLLSCCPIAAFCSQKFWIDNCLMLGVTAAAAAHVWLLPLPHLELPVPVRADCIDADTTANDTAARKKDGGMKSRKAGALGSGMGPCLLSGLVFGAVGLNTKITAAALLPFAALWIVLRLLYLELIKVADGESRSAASLILVVVGKSVLHTVVYVTGMCASYAPWAYLYYQHTGRLTPNAWPSATMLQRSSFVRAAVAKPWPTYVLTLLRVSPLHLLGLLGACVVLIWMLAGPFCHSASSASASASANAADRANGTDQQATAALCPHLRAVLPLVALSVWPAAFLVGLTVLGSAGSGFQSRFLMPMLPGSAILSAALLDVVRRAGTAGGNMRLLAGFCGCAATILAVYSAMHVLYYAVLYAPLFADLDVSLLDVLGSTLQSPYSAPDSRESFQAMLRFMAHYGMVRESS